MRQKRKTTQGEPGEGTPCFRDPGPAVPAPRPSNVEESEVLVDALQAANEALIRSNEGLQGVGEELETSLDMLQAANGALVLQNAALRERVAVLERLSSDLDALLADACLVEVDRALCLRRFTPEAGRLLGLSAADAGRPFAALAHGLDVPDLEQLLAQAAGAAAARHERALHDRSGRWYSMRVQPYHGPGDSGGAVVVLVELDRPPAASSD